jgi:hypothetical protein
MKEEIFFVCGRGLCFFYLVGHEKEQQLKEACLQMVIYYMEHSVTVSLCGVLGIDVFTLSLLNLFLIALE